MVASYRSHGLVIVFSLSKRTISHVLDAKADVVVDTLGYCFSNGLTLFTLDPHVLRSAAENLGVRPIPLSWTSHDKPAYFSLVEIGLPLSES